MFHSTETTLLSIHNDLILERLWLAHSCILARVLLHTGTCANAVLLTYLLTHLSKGSWWGHFSYSFWFIWCLWYCQSFHPTSSSSELFGLQSSWHFSSLVFILSYLMFSHLILPHVLKQSPFKIPLHLSQIFLVVYLKVLSLAQFFSRFIQLPLALSSQRTQSNTTSMLMTPSCTFLSLLQIQLLHLKYFPILFPTYSPKWTQTDCISIHPKLNFYSLVQNNNDWNFLDSQLYLSAMISSQSVLNLVILASSSILTCHSQIKINSLSKSCHFHIRDICRIRHLLPLSAATALANSLVSSKLDYCNSLYNGILQANLNKIQRIQITLARVVRNT